ncbi:MAG: hypothetical protein GC159_00870 [Phycisphaera sp.]|nr:hypothetical protein [Phycisphaera sp.]
MADTELLIMTAVRAEADPIIRRLELQAERFGVRGFGGASVLHRRGRVILCVTGMGAAMATSGIEWALSAIEPRPVLIVGVSGALDPAMKVGDVVTATRVIDDATGEVFASSGAAGGGADADANDGRTLVTVAAVAATPDAKAALRQRTGADLVDMESAAIARVCQQRGLAWTCVRAISDAANDTLPPGVERLVRPDGRANLSAAIVYALTHPHRIPGLSRLGRNTSIAAVKLADRVAGLCS